MKKKIEKGIIMLSQGWFGISNPFSSAFESYSGTTGKVIQLINWAIAASALVAVIVIVYGGYQFIMSEGDDEKIAKGTSTITSGVVGLVIVFLAGMIIRFVADKLL